MEERAPFKLRFRISRLLSERFIKKQIDFAMRLFMSPNSASNFNSARFVRFRQFKWPAVFTSFSEPSREDIFLKYHLTKTFKTDPPLLIQPVYLKDDHVPFIQIQNPDGVKNIVAYDGGIWHE